MTIDSLYNKEIITLQQFYRIKKFIQEQQKWMLSEQDPDHPMIKEEIEKQVVHFIDIYLWCIDPILLHSPHAIHQLARIWMEKKIYEMKPNDAATFIDHWLHMN